MSKIQIRQGVFETNSSSTHAICINTKGDIVKPIYELEITGEGEYGWGVEQYHNVEDKFNYLWQAIIEVIGCEYDYVWDEENMKLDPWQRVGTPEKVYYSIDERIKKIIEYRDKIKNWLKEENIKCDIKMPLIKIYDYKSLNNPDEKVISLSFKLDTIKDWNYIDHVDECAEFVEGVMSDKNIFMHYLFNKDSCICTGNDNGGCIIYPDKETYDLEFYKSN